jgi:hypothetical protein
VTERQRYILRVRTLARAVAEAYFASREALGFPMLKAMGGEKGTFLFSDHTENRNVPFSAPVSPTGN